MVTPASSSSVRSHTRRTLRLVVGLSLGLLACATTGAPMQFRSASLREPADAYACATSALEREGFGTSESSPEGRIAVMLRRPRPTAGMPPEWWRVEISIVMNEDDLAVLTAIAGASSRSEGPYRGPPPGLQHLIGVLMGRCTW